MNNMKFYDKAGVVQVVRVTQKKPLTGRYELRNRLHTPASAARLAAAMGLTRRKPK